MSSFQQHLVVFFAIFAASGPVRAQNSDADETKEEDNVKIPPLVLDVSRRSLKNFLKDEVALTVHRKSDGSVADLEDAFMIGSIEGRYAVFWDPFSCRLAGVLDIKAPQEKDEKPIFPPTREKEDESPSPYILLAEGASPLTGSLGTFGEANYFGFKMVDGLPEFLYTHGSIKVAERLWLEENGNVLKQRFSIQEPANSILITIPESWKERASTKVGTWDNQSLSVPVEDAGGVVITYRLNDEEEMEEDN